MATQSESDEYMSVDQQHVLSLITAKKEYRYLEQSAWWHSVSKELLQLQCPEVAALGRWKSCQQSILDSLLTGCIGCHSLHLLCSKEACSAEPDPLVTAQAAHDNGICSKCIAFVDRAATQIVKIVVC